MIKNYLRILVCGGSLLCSAAPPAMANFAISPSGATTLFAIDAANQGTALCAAVSTECGATVPINAAGAPLFTSGAPGLVTLTGTNTIAAVTAITNALPAGTNVLGHAIIDTGSTTAVTQATAANLNATVVGTGTFAVQATLQASGSTAIGKVDPNTIATWGLAAASQNVAAPTNGWLPLCQFTTSPTTISTTNVSPLQCTNANSLMVSVTNANANGATTESASSPITLPTNAHANAAWGQVATGAAPPSGVQYIGANASGAAGGHVAGLQSCDSHVFKHITSATDTLAVQGVASQIIYICGWRSRAAGVATWFLENTASANANCSSSNTQITGVATEAANTGETMLAAFWTGLKNTSGNGLCINSTGTGGVDVDIWYAQF